MIKEYGKNLKEYLENCDIFAGLPRQDIADLISSSVIREYMRGEVIRNSSVSFGGIGFILSGIASVSKGKTVISTLSAGDTFGAVDVFGGMKTPPSFIDAASDCIIACISTEEIGRLIDNNPAFAINYIRYLSRRVAFLTERIETVTGGSASEKLKSFILSSDTGEIDCTNMSLLAKKLDMSRATLYRAVSALEENKIIRRTENKIIIIK